MGTVKRLLCLVLATFAFLAPARASLYRGPALLPEWVRDGSAFDLDLTANVTAWPDLSEESMDVLRAWLSGAQLKLQSVQGENGPEQLAVLQHDGADLVRLHTQAGVTPETMTVEVPGHLPATRYLSQGETAPWNLLLGPLPAFPDFVSAGQALDSFAAQALPHLLGEEKAVKTSTTIRHAGTSASQLVYSLPTEKAKLFWEAAGPDLSTTLGQLFLALSAEEAPALQAVLSTLEIKGAITVKRFLDKQGEDLGFQITATLGLSGQTRKLTIFYGQSEKGLYFSYKLPATRGTDTLEAQLSLAYKEGEVKGDWRLKSLQNKERLDITGAVDLAFLDNRLSGSLEVEIKRPSAPLPRLRLTLEPVMNFSPEGLVGNLQIRSFAGKTLRHEILLTLLGRPSQGLEAPRAMAEILLEEGSTTQLEKARLDTALAILLEDYLSQLPLETRLLVLHDLGRNRRTQGDPVPPIGDVEPDDLQDFTVTDDDPPT